MLGSSNHGVMEWGIGCYVWGGLQVGEEDKGDERTIEEELGTTRGIWECGHEEEEEIV